MVHSVEAALCQARIANDISGGNGAIHMNILWEMGGAERILTEVLERANGLINGITCGAGMPYKLASISEKYKEYITTLLSLQCELLEHYGKKIIFQTCKISWCCSI